MDPQNPSSGPAAPEKSRAPGKMANSLVALGSAAVLTVYAAGYVRTRSAAARFAVEAADLRTPVPVAGAATAAAPQEFSEVRTLADATPTVPAAPLPKSVPITPPVGTVASDPSPVPSVMPTPAPTETATPLSSLAPPATPTTDPPSADATAATPEPAAAPVPPPAPRQSEYKDGTYLGWGYSRHGDIEASVVVHDGRVVSAEISQCLTRYSCSVIDMLPAQVISRQNAFVDLISGATESANAFSNAIYRALVSSKK
jgi:uncharacterized protein with FMN-binding domain